MDPQQELFTEILTQVRSKGYDVYDGILPQPKTPYPFVYMGDSQQLDDVNKSAVFGNVYQTIHVWHDKPTQRGTVSAMLLEIKKICYAIEHTKNFNWFVLNLTQRIIPDESTKRPLLHGILEIEFKFS